MAVGDMRYTFTDKQGKEHQVDIPAETLRKGRKDGLSNRDTIMLYLANNGYMVDATSSTQQKKKTPSKKVTRTRKPDQQKQSIINVLVDAVKQQDLSVNIINIERQFQFELEGEMFEVTLVKKRKPKS